jgi:hypothetical protein
MKSSAASAACGPQLAHPATISAADLHQESSARQPDAQLIPVSAHRHHLALWFKWLPCTLSAGARPSSLRPQVRSQLEASQASLSEARAAQSEVRAQLAAKEAAVDALTTLSLRGDATVQEYMSNVKVDAAAMGARFGPSCARTHRIPASPHQTRPCACDSPAPAF